VIRQRLIYIVPNVPSDAQSIRDLTHEQALGTYILKEHHELQRCQNTTGSMDGRPAIA
jgi:hypothetical protein